LYPTIAYFKNKEETNFNIFIDFEGFE